jgi:BirA family biotin operon repressor/biotin-[acetyl-CoA-carboxylase] ligase
MTVPTLPPFYSVHWYETIGSSNDAARSLAESGAHEGTLVWAGEQTAGRGRRGRGWSSPPGNLYLSLVLRPDVGMTVAPQLGFVCAIALGEAVAGVIPDGASRVRYKWPNDLLIDGAKTAGILLESGPSVTLEENVVGPAYVIAGMGTNIASAPTDTPYPATSLSQAGARDLAPGGLLERFARHFEAGYRIWRDDGFERVRGSWLAAGHRSGDPLTVRIGGGEMLSGRFLDLCSDGALLLELASGETRRISAGDVAMMAP